MVSGRLPISFGSGGLVWDIAISFGSGGLALWLFWFSCVWMGFWGLVGGFGFLWV